MMQLPEPWEELEADESIVDALKNIDFKMKHESNEAERVDPLPSIVVTQWVHIRNQDSHVHVYIELGGAPFNSRWYAMAVFFTSGDFLGGISGSDMRALPLSTICSIYEERETESIIQMSRFSIFGSQEVNPLDPLPKVGKKKTPRFYALVGVQYDAMQEANPDENIAEKMAVMNDVPLSTMQRWITKARKMALLAPAQWA